MAQAILAPGLMASTGMTLANAAASSLLSVTLFGTATSASYAASGQVDWALFAALVTGGLGGAAIGLPASRWLATRVIYGAYRYADRAEFRGLTHTSRVARVADIISGR